MSNYGIDLNSNDLSRNALSTINKLRIKLHDTYEVEKVDISTEQINITLKDKEGRSNWAGPTIHSTGTMMQSSTVYWNWNSTEIFTIPHTESNYNELQKLLANTTYCESFQKDIR